MINLQIDQGGLDRLVIDVSATQKQAVSALNSTLRKMASWLRSRSIKSLSADLQIQQKLLRRRLKALKIKANQDGSQVTLWYGLDPFALIYLNPKKTSSGVTATGGRSVAGGFKANAKGGGAQVFKRIGSARLPIQKQVAPIQKQSEKNIEKSIDANSFDLQFWKTFEHELKWQTR